MFKSSAFIFCYTIKRFEIVPFLYTEFYIYNYIYWILLFSLQLIIIVK